MTPTPHEGTEPRPTLFTIRTYATVRYKIKNKLMIEGGKLVSCACLVMW